MVSDSHDAHLWVERYLEKANREGYDAVIHLGDGSGDVRWLQRRLRMPLIKVAGNCDFYSKEPREARPSFEGHRILAVHGDKYDVKYGYERLSYYAEEIGVDIALSGHTHRPFCEYVGRVLVVNPGALNMGRYAELTLDGARVVPCLYDFKAEYV